MNVIIPDHLKGIVSQDFTATCTVCGATVTVVASTAEPHACRIDLDAQRGLA